MSQNNIITRKELELTVAETESLINTLVLKKYAEGNEKTLGDVIERIIKIVEEKGNKKYITPKILNDIKVMLREGYFIPGGSILSGLSNNKTLKSSLSNCYVLKIERDCIEDIFKMFGEMAKTYSYRGGCGVDITVLRPNCTPVSNAAKESTGAVSFMPMISNVTETIGQSGRRGAMMITMDIRHPDIMEFIWSKADPERVFYQDHMNKTHIGKKILNLLGPIHSTDPNIFTRIEEICKEGKVPTVDSANISIKYSDEFMTAVRNDESWVCLFPDIDADKIKYDLEWDGDYEKWVANSGKLRKHTSYTATITKDNYSRFIDHFTIENDQEILLTKEYLISLVKNGSTQVTMKIPTARQIFHDACLAAWLRGDPGALFWDRVNTWTTMSVLHDLLKFLSTNPCSEIPSYAGGSCLLGSHVLSRYVKDPWNDDDVKWDSEKWKNFSIAATYLMNVFSDINEEMHPLEEQIRLEKFAKRIGIEFTALGDMCAMLSMEYGDNQETLHFIESIMRQKSVLEIFASNQIAKSIGCCTVFDKDTNPGVRERFLNTPYVKHLKLSIELKEDILKFGLRNVGFNTVGPTGSLSILMDNCSSGIEPIFAFTYTRTTRVGDQQEYKICHTPLARYLLSQDQDTWNLDEIKNKYKIKTAHELGYQDRIAVQSAIQLYCDSSISSTLNLPKDCTVNNIMDIYIEAWEAGLKGVTVYRDSSLSGVLNIEPQEEKEEENLSISTREQTRKTFDDLYSIPEDTKFEISQLGRGELLDPQRDSTAKSHRIAWNGYNMYITITLDTEGQPLELFISNLPREVSVKNEVFDPIDYQEKLSLWMAVTRLVSIGLRGGIPVVQFVKQLNKASFVINDLMSIVARVLSKYVGDPTVKEKAKDMSIEQLTETDFTSVCPKCKQKTYINQGGCGQCMNSECCYTRC